MNYTGQGGENHMQKFRLTPVKGSRWFSRAYHKGKSYNGTYFAMYVIRGKEKDRTLLGITVSKKRGKAVMRNRVKRWIREAYRTYLPVLKNGYIIVIVAKQPAVTAGLAVLREELGSLLGRATLLDSAV